MAWRWELERAVRERVENVILVHPPRYYRYDASFHKTEREVMQWDLSQIRDSHIVVVNLENISQSIGTHMELGFIEALNQTGDQHIYVIGVGIPDVDHPWLNEILHRREDTVAEAADYITTYLLV